MMMQCTENESPAYIKTFPYAHVPYATSLAALASASSNSICSDSSSQASDDSAGTAATSVSSLSTDSDSCESYCLRSTTSHLPDLCDRPAAPLSNSPQWKQTAAPPAAEVPALAPGRRTNPRRTGSGSTTRTGCPPALVRQSDRKVNFVDSLVDSSTQIVETIWPLSSIACRSEMGSKGVLPLRTFIQETLRRSRTSYSTLQVALYYLILIKPHVPTHDFTMEQPDDVHLNRVLQCGRRMFLAALILASKYLQDRNFSARAWSRISGLNTQEINQNEIAFLVAVNWKLHITDEIFQRWTEIVLKFTPHPQPPSSPGAAFPLPCESLGLDWKQVIRKLNPELDNVDGLISLTPKPKRSPASPPVRIALPTPPAEPTEAAPSPIARSYSVPLVLEPTPASVCSTSGRLAAFGLLPTPRLTPQCSGYNTPAVSAASLLLGKSSMGLAMSQAASVGAAQNLDRWPSSNTSSPQCYLPTRRSSLANSVSAASSPESMISDSSRTSRSSSTSSASSLVSAPSTKLDLQVRYRHAKLWRERYMRPTTIIASVPEDYEENCLTSSPEPYDNMVGKDACDLDDLAGVTNAARTLQSLAATCGSASMTVMTPSPSRAGSKRSRTNSLEKDGLQDNVRELLQGRSGDGCEPIWSDNVVRQGSALSYERAARVPVPSPYRTGGGSKRLCCSAEVLRGYSHISSLHPAIGGAGGPGMWNGILDD